MGPGLLVKALSGRHISLMIFGFSQIAIDIEPLVRIIRGDTFVHGFTHAYLGATLVGLVSVVIGRPCCAWLLNRWIEGRQSHLEPRGSSSISVSSAISGALVGTYSHVFLDSIMHSDMRPFAPWSDANAVLHVISVGRLHNLCMLSGVLGALMVLAVFLVRRRGEVDSQR